MADVFSPAKRSLIMAAIKGKGTKTTELAVRRLLRIHRITGWRAHIASIIGKPDFVFLKRKIAVFVDGCFWHGCPKCRRNLKPTSNSAFWCAKFQANRRRDKVATAALRRKGWRVLRLWEHDIRKKPGIILRRITAMLPKT